MRPSSRGMVTAEFAVAILLALSMVLALCAGVQLVILQVQCIDVASAVARQAARGDDAGVRQARAAAPGDAEIDVVRGRQLITVSVSMLARPLGGALPPVRLRAVSAIRPEPES